ncbi:MAG: glutamate decarboxylase [Acidimicrobiales bacterium]
MPLHPHTPGPANEDDLSFRPQFSQHGGVGDVPRLRLANKGMPPRIAFQIIHDELMLDGNARLNLATFVTTWMEPEAELLMAECASKNMIDKDEYPQTAEIERRCVNILARLWHADGEGSATGCSTTGSSEACMLGGLALKWRWRQRRTSNGLPAERPNLVMGANVQVCWEKFCRYFDVEARLVPVGPDVAHLTPERAAKACDENTIGVVAVLGSTYDGTYEPVAEIAAALDALAAAGGPDVPVHVDGASGGLVAPFLDADLKWDFQLPRVQSINVSGHKFGLVYPGVGWILWRDADALPEDLVFKVNYLGGEMPTFALNFSRPGAQVVAQYYNFLRLGFDGYRDVQTACRDTAQWLAAEVGRLGPFSLVSRAEGIPVFAFRLTDTVPYSVYDISEALRSFGWLVPAYTLPPDLDEVSVLRVVVRNGFSRDLARLLLSHLEAVVNRLAASAEPHGGRAEMRTTFHH